MNKKIASEVAVGIILLFAIIIGALIWLNNKKIEKAPTPAISQPAVKPSCEDSNISDELIDSAVTEALTGLKNPWGNVSDFELLIERIENKLGCTLKKDSGIYTMQPKPSQQSAQSATIGHSAQSSNNVANILADWKTYKNDKYGFNIIYPSSWTLENNYKSASEKGDVGIVGIDNEFITLTSPTNNYINVGVTKKDGFFSDTGDDSTGLGLDKFVSIGSVKINNQTSQFSFISGQNNTVSSGTLEPIESGDYEIHAFFLFVKDQKQSLLEKDQDFQTAVKIIESIKLPRN
jgi:hypothetical protein